jgi:excisionase family DNA binding protein
MENLVSARELAASLNVSLSTVYSWVERGQIPAQHVGRCLRFVPSEIERWLETQRRPELDGGSSCEPDRGLRRRCPNHAI